MLTIVWNPNGFHVINILSKRIKFSADYDRCPYSIGGTVQNPGRQNRSKADRPCRERTPPHCENELGLSGAGWDEKHFTHRTHLIWHRLI
jgi:hypothetical protein